MTDPKAVEVPDSYWVGRARAGDADAFEQLVRRHQHGVYAFCWRLTGDHDRADETAQETFVRAYCSLGRFRGEALFGTWLRQIALNLVRSRMRRRRFEATGDADLEALAAHAAGGSRPGSPEPDPIGRRRLQEAVQRLPERQRLTLILKVYEEMTHVEVARVLECSVGTVKANLFHALRTLRRVLRGAP